jgi:hypothetical protein
MPKKQRRTSQNSGTGKLKANLGQKEAELEETSKVQMSHMGVAKAANRLSGNLLNAALNRFGRQATSAQRT